MFDAEAVDQCAQRVVKKGQADHIQQHGSESTDELDVKQEDKRSRKAKPQDFLIPEPVGEGSP